MSNVKTGRSSLKRQEMKEKRRKRQQRQRILLFSAIGLVALVIIAIAVVPQLIPTNVKEPQPVARSQVDKNTAGDPSAPVKIVEFSDFQCPYCRDFNEQVEPALVEEYIDTGKVHFTYRSMGQWIGAESSEAAEAAYCAGDQGKFWEYHDTLFANWNGENLGSFNNKRLNDFARYLKLDMGDFDACRSSNKYIDQVNQDRADGDRLEVQGTPAFIINNQMYAGPLTIDGFRQAIEAAISATQ